MAYSRQEVRAGSGGKTPEIAGRSKQYSERKFSGFFPMISDPCVRDSVTGIIDLGIGQKILSNQ
jgi:hypothetical protein